MASIDWFGDEAGSAADRGGVAIHSVAGSALVWLWGELDLAAAAEVRSGLRDAAVVGGGEVVVDLSQVTFLDASILGELVRGRLSAEAASSGFSVRSPSGCARRLLELCELTEMIGPVSAAGSGGAFRAGLG